MSDVEVSPRCHTRCRLVPADVVRCTRVGAPLITFWNANAEIKLARVVAQLLVAASRVENGTMGITRQRRNRSGRAGVSRLLTDRATPVPREPIHPT